MVLSVFASKFTKDVNVYWFLVVEPELVECYNSLGLFKYFEKVSFSLGIVVIQLDTEFLNVGLLEIEQVLLYIGVWHLKKMNKYFCI